jgi:hypothetical protein
MKMTKKENCSQRMKRLGYRPSLLWLTAAEHVKFRTLAKCYRMHLTQWIKHACDEYAAEQLRRQRLCKPSQFTAPKTEKRKSLRARAE